MTPQEIGWYGVSFDKLKQFAKAPVGRIGA
jgi:hypothetical protein